MEESKIEAAIANSVSSQASTATEDAKEDSCANANGETNRLDRLEEMVERLRDTVTQLTPATTSSAETAEGSKNKAAHGSTMKLSALLETQTVESFGTRMKEQRQCALDKMLTPVEFEWTWKTNSEADAKLLLIELADIRQKIMLKMERWASGSLLKAEKQSAIPLATYKYLTTFEKVRQSKQNAFNTIGACLMVEHYLLLVKEIDEQIRTVFSQYPALKDFATPMLNKRVNHSSKSNLLLVKEDKTVRINPKVNEQLTLLRTKKGAGKATTYHRSVTSEEPDEYEEDAMYEYGQDSWQLDFFDPGSPRSHRYLAQDCSSQPANHYLRGRPLVWINRRAQHYAANRSAESSD